MPWAKFSDDSHDSEKILALSVPARWLWAAAIMDNRGYKGGRSPFISVIRAEALARQQDLPLKLIQELQDKGRWESTDGGWNIHHYEEFLPTRREEANDHEPDPVKQAAGKKGAAARQQSTNTLEGRGAAGVLLATDRQQTGNPVARGPVPVPTPRPVLDDLPKAPPTPSVHTDRGIQVVEWWCLRQGWQQVPPSKASRTYQDAEALASLDLSEEELLGLLDEVWTKAEEKPATLAYFWRPAQQCENETLKVRKPVMPGLRSVLKDLDPNRAPKEETS